MAELVIDKSKCIYCGACVSVCPFLCLRLRETFVEEEGCKACGSCVKACPAAAIKLKE